MSYRDDLAALSARRDALDREVAQKARELEQVSGLLEEARARTRLPILDNLGVASPCQARWSEMTGGRRVRRCGDCDRTVYDLSDMTRDEAEALIAAKEGRLCVRYLQRADGTILLDEDCATDRRRCRRRVQAVIGVAVALLAAAAAVLGWKLARASEPEPEPGPAELRYREMIGKYDGVRPSDPRSGLRFE